MVSVSNYDQGTVELCTCRRHLVVLAVDIWWYSLLTCGGTSRRTVYRPSTQNVTHSKQGVLAADARGEFISGADHMGSMPTIQEPYR